MSIRIIARLIARPDAIGRPAPEIRSHARTDPQGSRLRPLPAAARQHRQPGRIHLRRRMGPTRPPSTRTRIATAHLKGLVANTQALLAEPLDVRLYTSPEARAPPPRQVMPTARTTALHAS